VRRKDTPAAFRWGRSCEQWFRRGHNAVRRRVAALRLCAAARRVDPAAIAARLAAEPAIDVVLLPMAAGPEPVATLRRAADAWATGLVPPHRVWIATDAGPRLHDRCGMGKHPPAAAGPAGTGRPFARRRATLATVRETVAACDTSHVVLAEADATPEPDCLAWMTVAIRETPGLVAVYGDERIGADPAATATPDAGERLRHHPDFSWLYLLSRNFLGAAVLYRTDLLLGALDALLARNAAATRRGDVLHAVALQALRHATRDDVAHVPQPLSRRTAPAAAWPEGPGSAVAAALETAGVRATVDRHPDVADLHRIRLRPSRRPHVSVIVPTRNGAALVASCLGDLRNTAGYDPYDVTVVDHDSDEPALATLFAAETRAGGLARFPWNGPFNFAAMNNAAVAATRGTLLLFLNNDVDGFAPGWLEQLVATFELDRRIGAVGGLLFYPDGHVQHAGVVLDPKRMCHHAHYGWPGDTVGYDGRIHALQQYSAVTAALMMVRRDAFERIGGFDPRFPDDYNDVDLCLRLGEAGYAVAYNPVVQATHCEGRTRRVKETGRGDFQHRWRHAFARDPWSHPRFGATDFRPDPLDRHWREQKLVALAEAAARPPVQPAARAVPELRRRSA
jgi:GT2 family glycosyltransferase